MKREKRREPVARISKGIERSRNERGMRSGRKRGK